MKIDIVLLRITVGDGIDWVLEKKEIRVRVPADIKELDLDSVSEILKRRRKRREQIALYRQKWNSREREKLVPEFKEVPTLSNKKWHLVSWSPVISLGALEFICEKF